jgi:hypothetical protein
VLSRLKPRITLPTFLQFIVFVAAMDQLFECDMVLLFIVIILPILSIQGKYVRILNHNARRRGVILSWRPEC